MRGRGLCAVARKASRQKRPIGSKLKKRAGGENEKSRCSINMNEKFTDFVSVVSRTVKRMDRRTDEQTNRRDGEHDGKNSVKKQQSPWTKLVKVNNCLSTAN